MEKKMKNHQCADHHHHDKKGAFVGCCWCWMTIIMIIQTTTIRTYAFIEPITTRTSFLSARHRVGHDYHHPWTKTNPKDKTLPLSSPVASFMNNDDESNAMKNDGGLTSALARLDQVWEIQQSTQSSLKNKWTKFILENDEKETNQDEGESPTAKAKEFVYLLEPPNVAASIISPSCMIVFTGGAGLGQFPHIAYNEFLSNVSTRLNAVVFAVPYQVGLDHFTLAKTTGDLLRRAIIQYQDDNNGMNGKNAIPTYAVAHSLGAKLQTIYMAATNQYYDGVGFMSFNNFGFASTIGMARSFATEFRKNKNNGSIFDGGPEQEMMVNTILNFAEAAVGAIGVEFTPNPQDTERLIELKYKSSTANYCEKTRLFVFDDDSLDNSFNFYNKCDPNGDNLSVSWLSGTHLTPVYFKFDLNEIVEDVGIPNEMASQAVGGFQGASFGNKDELSGLVDEVCNWIVGKPPANRPPSNWGAAEKDKGDGGQQQGPPKSLSGGIVDAETVDE